MGCGYDRIPKLAGQRRPEVLVSLSEWPTVVGKSIISAFLVDLLKAHHPEVVEVYFFCESEEPKLADSCQLKPTALVFYSEGTT
jgi:hypothetical protein